MKMRNEKVSYAPFIPKGEPQNDLKNRLKEIVDKYKNLGPHEKVNLSTDPSKSVKPHWACIWNDQKKIGQKCVILATDGYFSIVLFPEDKSVAYYRNEDLTQE
jgi:hypothetical protein